MRSLINDLLIYWRLYAIKIHVLCGVVKVNFTMTPLRTRRWTSKVARKARKLFPFTPSSLSRRRLQQASSASRTASSMAVYDS